MDHRLIPKPLSYTVASRVDLVKPKLKIIAIIVILKPKLIYTQAKIQFQVIQMCAWLVIVFT